MSNAAFHPLAPATEPVLTFTREAPPARLAPGSLARRHVLFLLAPAGHATQEVLIPADRLAAAGASLTFATIGADAVRFDPLCNALAVLEAAWSPALRLLTRASRDGTLRNLVDLRRLVATGELDTWLRGFDAVVVPGGHGETFAGFIADPLLARVLGGLYDGGARLGLICHAVVAGARALRADGERVLAGHHVTCWPASLERPLSGLPWLGDYLAPFATDTETEVRAVAARVCTSGPLPVAVRHGPIVTTWGPWTCDAFADALGAALAEVQPRAAVQALPKPSANLEGIRVEHDRPWENWAANFSCRPETLAHPETAEEVAAIIRYAAAANKTVRAVGSGYSYTRLVQTDAVMVCLDRLVGIERIERIDADRGVVRVRAGTPLHVFTRLLAEQGWALPVMGDIDRQTLGGVVATATHGTGLGFGSYSCLVDGLTLVDGRGQIRELGANDPDLRYARAALGALGIVTHVELRVVPHHHLAVKRWGARLGQVLAELDQHVNTNRNFEFFWFPGTDVVSCKSMALAPAARAPWAIGRFFNEMVIENGLGWLASEALRVHPAVRRALDVIAPYIVADETSTRPAEDAYATPRLVKHQEIEYALPIENAAAAIREIEAVTALHPSPGIFPFEVRFAPAEDVPLSPAYRRTTVWIAAHTYVKEDHHAFFARCEEIFVRHGGRPHWGKLHTRTRDDFAAMYPEWDSFCVARDAFDPDRRFANPYLAKVLGD